MSTKTAAVVLREKNEALLSRGIIAIVAKNLAELVECLEEFRPEDVVMENNKLLKTAIGEGSLEAVSILLRYGATDTDTVDGVAPPLVIAVYRRNLAIVQLLLDVQGENASSAFNIWLAIEHARIGGDRDIHEYLVAFYAAMQCDFLVAFANLESARVEHYLRRRIIITIDEVDLFDEYLRHVLIRSEHLKIAIKLTTPNLLSYLVITRNCLNKKKLAELGPFFVAINESKHYDYYKILCKPYSIVEIGIQLAGSAAMSQQQYEEVVIEKLQDTAPYQTSE